jgi:hypothetical protein
LPSCAPGEGHLVVRWRPCSSEASLSPAWWTEWSRPGSRAGAPPAVTASLLIVTKGGETIPLIFPQPLRYSAGGSRGAAGCTQPIEGQPGNDCKVLHLVEYRKLLGHKKFEPRWLYAETI